LNDYRASKIDRAVVPFEAAIQRQRTRFFLDHRLKAGDDIVDATALCGLKAKFTFH